MLPQNSGSISAQKVIPKVRKRVLKACLAVAVMAQLSERRVLSATNIISVFKKRYNIQLSAGTVYPVLYALEKDGSIRSLPNRRKKLYVLTNKGKATIKNDLYKIRRYMSRERYLRYNLWLAEWTS